MWNVAIQFCPNCNSCLSKPALKSGYGWVIASFKFIFITTSLLFAAKQFWRILVNIHDSTGTGSITQNIIYIYYMKIYIYIYDTTHRVRILRAVSYQLDRQGTVSGNSRSGPFSHSMTQYCLYKWDKRLITKQNRSILDSNWSGFVCSLNEQVHFERTRWYFLDEMGISHKPQDTVCY